MHTPHWLLRVILLVLLVFVVTTPLATTQSQSSAVTIESDNALVAPVGNWTPTATTHASGGSYLLNSGSPNETLTLDFSGPYLEIIYVAAPWTGTMVIEIDGVERRTVDTSGDLALHQRVVFEHLSNDAHTLQVYGVAGDFVAVDAFVTVPRVDDVARAPTAANPVNISSSGELASLPFETQLPPSLTPEMRNMGSSVDIDGTRVVVGDQGYVVGDVIGAGAIFVYDLQPDGTWVETRLVSSNPQTISLGGRVELSGDRIVAGGSYAGGNLVVFERQHDGSWTDSNLATVPGTDIELNSRSFSLDGDRLLVTSYLPQIKAYLLEAVGDGTWVNTAVMDVPLVEDVALEGNRALLAVDSTDSPPAVIFEQQLDGSWVKATVNQPNRYPAIGGVSISGDRAIIGNYFGDGEAYIYERQGDGTWQERVLTPSSPYLGGGFGIAADNENNRMVIAAHNAPSLEGTTYFANGAIHIFDRQPDNSWQETILVSSDYTKQVRFGNALALQGDTLVVGQRTLQEALVYNLAKRQVFVNTDDVSPLNENAPETTTSFVVHVPVVTVGQDVVIDVTTDGQCTVSPQQLTYAAPGPKTITIAVVDDVDLEDRFHACAITATVNNALSDTAYHDISKTLAVDVADNDVAADTNLLENGDFSGDSPFGLPWRLYGDFQYEINNGVMEFYRKFPGWQGAQLYQNVAQRLPANTPLEVNVALGNSSNMPKGVEIRLRNLDWTDVISCAVTIPPNMPLYNFTMQGLTSRRWDDLNLTISALDNDGLPALRVDDASVNYAPDAGITGLHCQGFEPPTFTNLLRNGDFTNGRFYWALWGLYEFSVNDGVMAFYRISSAPLLANLYTQAAYSIMADRTIRLDIQIGNSSNVTKEVSVMLRDSQWRQNFNCTYVLPPNTPLTTVRVQGMTDQRWSNPFVMVRALDADGQAAVLVDNAVVQYLPGVAATPQCGGTLPRAN